jgi:tRNA(Arg) A34 adenosine deaminase TadA
MYREEYMRRAIEEARRNITDQTGGPFGACIVRDGRVLAVARNSVLAEDATCHAEINAIRLASKELGTFDLSGSVIYSTTEPCPMCFSAIHWAHIDAIYYGTSIEDVKKLGFNELCISNTAMKELGGASVDLHYPLLYDECINMLEDWKKQSGNKLY